MTQFRSFADLYQFFISQSNSFSFSSDGENVIVCHEEVNLDFSNDDVSIETDDTIKVHLKACHTGLNRNMSYISYENMENAISSFQYKPILATVHQLDNGEWDFYTHDIGRDENGQPVYIEKPIGVVMNSDDSNIQLVYDAENNKTYVECDGLIYKMYAQKAYEILKEKKTCKASVEILVKKLEYDNNTHVMKILDFSFTGITILGRDKKGRIIEEGMEGSNITLDCFMQERKTEMETNELFDENTAVDTENVVEEVVDETMSETEPVEDTVETVVEAEEVTDETESAEENFEEETPAEEITEENFETENEPEVNEIAPQIEEHFSNYSTVTYSVNVDDIRAALRNQITDCKYNYVYELYNDYAIMACYDTDWNQTFKRVKYSVIDDTVSVYGIENVKNVWVSDAEMANYNAMAQQITDLQAQITQMQTEVTKNLDTLFSARYENIKDTEVYASACQGITTFSNDQMKNKLDAELLAFYENNQPTVKKQAFAFRMPDQAKTKTNERYGNIFPTK